jgi:hypothetical protein
VAHLPGFAAELAEMPLISGPQGWQIRKADKAGPALVRAGVQRRQSWRWDVARNYVGSGRGAEATGMLDLMAQDDPDLPLVPNFMLARGIAMALSNRPTEALAAFNMPLLTNNAEACAWRMRVLAEQGDGADALMQLACAAPALSARKGGEARPFLLAGAHAAIAGGDMKRALGWLARLPDADVEANLLRGRAMLSLGQAQAGRLRLARVAQSGSYPQKIEAELSNLEGAMVNGANVPKDMDRRLDRIGFIWRGGDIELRALRLRYRIAKTSNDVRGQLASGAAMMRYHSLGSDSGPMLSEMQGRLTELLAPGSKVPVAEGAGLFWDYRDVAPSGAQGDALLGRLASSLQAAGLYNRAAELLSYQLTARAQDVEKGPLSERIAILYILAGHPDLAIRILRQSDDIPYPDEIRWSRQRVEAVALHLMGKDVAALAVLDQVPGTAGLRAEMAWQSRDWKALADRVTPLAAGRPLTEVDQALILRQAIALAMLGREADIASLRQRYATTFSRTRSADAFDLVTKTVGSLTPGMVARAMAAIPTASAAGDLADLMTSGQRPGGYLR